MFIKQLLRVRDHVHLNSVCAQVEVIKKAYTQEIECEEVEVPPREVGHNIYILAQQVATCRLLIGSLKGYEPTTFSNWASLDQMLVLKLKLFLLFVCSWHDTTKPCRTS